MNAQHIGMFFFCFFKTIGKIIVISPVGINKTGRNIDDDSLIGQRIVHLHAVDIIPVYEDNVVRFQRICLSFYKVLHITGNKNRDFVEFVVMKFKFCGNLIGQMKNLKVTV